MGRATANPERETLTNQRVLVTGGGGFLGSHLVEHLAREGATVGALSRHEGKLAGIHPSTGVVFLPCDLTDADQARKAIASFAPRILFHFAAHPDARESFGQSDSSIRANLLATLNTLEAFRLTGGELFIYGDSCKVYGNCKVPYRASRSMKPLSSYAIAKAAGWQLCDVYRRTYGMATISVRPTLIYGPRQGYNLITHVTEKVLSQELEVRLDGGMQTRDPLYVDDAMEAFLAAARQGRKLSGRVISIGGGKEHTVFELAETIVQLMGSKLRVVADSGRIRATETQRSFCDNLEAKRLLNWQPATDLRSGLEKTIQFQTASSSPVVAGGSLGE